MTQDTQTTKKLRLTDYLNDINYLKENLLRGDDAAEAYKGFVPFIINKILAGELDTLQHAVEMNVAGRYGLDKQLQYDYLINAVRKRKRFTPFIKKEKIEYLNLVAEFFQISPEKAKSALALLSQKQLDEIEARMYKGT